MNQLIEAKSIKKRFKDKEVLHGIDMYIGKGEVVALIGSNGAGKSTTIAIMLGILSPDGGSVSRWKDDYRRYLGVQLQSTPFFEGYSAEENLCLFAAFYGVNLNKKQIKEKLDVAGLRGAGKTLASKLSIGQQKRLAIMVTTLHDPELVILDEPTAGLDPKARKEIKELIKGLAQKNKSILFSSHDMDEVEKLADRIIFLHQGKVLETGKPHDIMNKYKYDNLEDLYIYLTDKEADYEDNI